MVFAPRAPEKWGPGQPFRFGPKNQKSRSLSSYCIGSSEKGDSGVTNRDFHFLQFAYVYGTFRGLRGCPDLRKSEF